MKLALFTLLGTLLATTAGAAIQMEPIAYAQGETQLQGYIVYDDAAPAKRPGILVVHEWWGLNDYAKKRARQLAANGYVAFAVDMYGEGKVTEHPQEAAEWAGAVNDAVREDRFQAALDLLKNHERVNAEKIGAIGYCFGGGAVLRLAAAGFDLDGVVSFHGSLPTSAVEPGTIKASMLVCHGSADPFTPADQVLKFEEVMNAAGADWQLIAYANAKHSFTVESAGERGIPALEYNAAADRRSWAAMLAFFEEVFAD